ncbi:HSP90 family protein, partial [Sanguibacter sp. 25GB23B1]
LPADRRRSAGKASPLWGGIVARADEYLSGAAHPDGDASARARLCLNWTSPLVRSLVAVRDDAVFTRTVHLMYIQALLAGHNPLGAAERRLMTQAMSDILALSVGLDDVDLVPFND